MKDIVEIINDNQEFLRIYNNQKEEIERLNNIIYTTLEYVDREEINSIGTPYTYTERGKHIKELLEGERTFNSLWQENKRLNNIIDKAIDKIQYIIDYGFDYDGFNNIEDLKGLIDMLVQYAVESRNILKGSDKE